MNLATKNKINKVLATIFKKIFKEKKTNYSMDNTHMWDSLNHLKLISEIQDRFKIKLSNFEISKITDEKKIKILLTKKLTKKVN
jgi:acyl carrier protein